MIRPWLFLSRFRIFGAIAVTLVVLLALAFFMDLFRTDTPASNLSSLRALLNISLLPPILGYVFGWTPVTGAPGASSIINSYPRFLLTRPISRNTVLCAPIAVFLVSVALIPLFSIVLILGGLRIFHPASISHLHAILELMPPVRALGPHATLVQMLAAIDLPRRYFAGISVGLCVYALLASQRWLTLSPSRKLQLLGIVPAVFIIAPSTLQFVNARIVSAILLSPARRAEGTYVPSAFGIALHLLIAAAITLGCWRIMRTAEI